MLTRSPGRIPGTWRSIQLKIEFIDPSDSCRKQPTHASLLRTKSMAQWRDPQEAELFYSDFPLGSRALRREGVIIRRDLTLN